jgi:hypothetical protein
MRRLQHPPVTLRRLLVVVRRLDSLAMRDAWWSTSRQKTDYKAGFPPSRGLLPARAVRAGPRQA